MINDILVHFNKKIIDEESLLVCMISSGDLGQEEVIKFARAALDLEIITNGQVDW